VALANERLEAYDVAAVVDAVDRFVDDLSTWYLRRSRRRFARSAESQDRQAAFSTLHQCLVTLARLVAPIMPFIAEDIYQNIVRSSDPSAPESVHLTPYPVPADRAVADAEIHREMELTRAIVTLGRAARNDVGIRVRQPLPAITVAGATGDVQVSTELMGEIADELNVKRVEIAKDVSAFARRVVRPVPRLLGPRLGSRFPAVQRAIQAGDYAINGDGSVTAAGETLAPAELSVTLEPLDNQAVAQDLQWHGGLAIALDRRVTTELHSEGLAREIVHRVQMMRRDAGLSVEDHVELAYETSSDTLQQVFEGHGDRIAHDVGAVAVKSFLTRVQTETPGSSSSWAGPIEGEPLTLIIEQCS